MAKNIVLPAPVSRDRVRDVLRARCPDLDLGTIGVGISAASSRWVAAVVFVNGKRVSVIPMVHGVGMFFVFLLLALTGLGIVIYAVTAVPRQLALTKRVRAVLAQELRAGAPAVAGAS